MATGIGDSLHARGLGSAIVANIIADIIAQIIVAGTACVHAVVTREQRMLRHLLRFALALAGTLGALSTLVYCERLCKRLARCPPVRRAVFT